MQINTSHSFELVLELGKYEAQQLHVSVVEPPHLFLGICKVLVIDLIKDVSLDHVDDFLGFEKHDALEEILRETRRVREIFDSAGSDPNPLHRKIIESLGVGQGFICGMNQLSLSTSAEVLVGVATQFAKAGDYQVLPIHLLKAILNARNDVIERALRYFFYDRKKLLEAVELELILRHSPMDFDGLGSARWN